jgi:methionyl-tRNA formyltransferase
MVRILFAGMPEMGPLCLDALYKAKKNIVGIIMPPKNNMAIYNTMLNMAYDMGIEPLSYEKRMDEPDFIQKVREKEADVGIVASFNRKFPKVLLESTKLGFINSHPSLLPLYRGGNPYFYPIFNNDKETGITLHFMDEDFDTGDIVYQRSVSVLPYETMGTLFNRTNFLFAQAHVDLVTFLEEGKTLPRMPQDKEGKYQTADMLHEYLGDTKINWGMSAELVERFIRATNPFLGATSFYKGNPIKFYSGIVDTEKPVDTDPGKIVEVTDSMIAISTGKGWFYPITMQVGSYFSSDVKMFVQFVRPKVGDSFD